MTTKIPNDELGKLMASGNPELHVADTMGTYYVGFNYNSKLYEELGLSEEEAKVFRHALCLLIDREYIIDNIAQTGQQPATTIVPATCVDGTFKTKDYYSADDYEANVEEAKSLLESIGLWDGTKLTKPIAFDYMVNKSDLHVKTAEALQQDWGQIGIEVTIKTEEWNVFLEDRKKGNFDVARMGWYMDFDDPINILEMWTTASGNNDCQFGRVVG
jgi:peptide/nickel transport system substrate-binding protein/oligopeptide transport system substrate-binding protein